MFRHAKLKKLEPLLKRAQGLSDKTAGDADFIAWREATKLALQAIFGADSLQYRSFDNRAFTSTAVMRNVSDDDKKQRRLKMYNRDLQVSIKALEDYIETITEEDPFMGMTIVNEPQTAQPVAMQPTTRKVFISHASADKLIVGELIEMLKQIGLRHGQIFCTSFPEYSIPLGANYLDWLRKELNENTLVLFVLSQDFYKSPICLSEMGATWALSKEHIPIMVPPFTYDDTKGPFPLSQGMVVTEKFKYNNLASIVERLFELPARDGDWERSRDAIISRIEGHLATAAAALKAKLQAEEDERTKTLRELAAIVENTEKELKDLTATPNRRRPPNISNI